MKYNVRTREKILEIAKEKFLKGGFYKTTTRAIATEAGINIGLLSYYFDNKKNLAKEAHDIIVNEIYDNIDLSKYTYNNAIEKLYLSYLLVQKEANLMEGFLKFHIELLGDNESSLQSNIPSSSKSLIDDIISEEDIPVSPNMRKVYHGMRSGSEFTLLKGKLHGDFDINYLELNELLVINITSLLNIDRDKTKQCIDNINAQLDDEIKSVLLM